MDIRSQGLGLAKADLKLATLELMEFIVDLGEGVE